MRICRRLRHDNLSSRVHCSTIPVTKESLNPDDLRNTSPVLRWSCQVHILISSNTCIGASTPSSGLRHAMCTDTGCPAVLVSRAWTVDEIQRARAAKSMLFPQVYQKQSENARRPYNIRYSVFAAVCGTVVDPQAKRSSGSQLPHIF